MAFNVLTFSEYSELKVFYIKMRRSFYLTLCVCMSVPAFVHVCVYVCMCMIEETSITVLPELLSIIIHIFSEVYENWSIGPIHIYTK